MKQFSFVMLILCLSTVLPAQGQTPAQGEVSIRFYNRAVYYPGNSPAEQIFIHVTIKNPSPDTLRFKLADDRSFSVDFNAANTRNLFLDHTEDWKRRQSTSRQVFFREVSLEPGESFSFVENLKDYLAITEPGMYILQCRFYPELLNAKNAGSSFASNRLTLDIKPSPGPAGLKSLPIAAQTGEILKAESIPPDQVVMTVITARQKGLWDQFFVYFDLDRMIKRDPALGRRYNSESETGRLAIIERYKADLKQERIDRELSVIPNRFEIERTMYTATEGTVSVIEWFDQNNYTEKKRFVYYVWSRNNVWLIYNYTVENLGNE